MIFEFNSFEKFVQMLQQVQIDEDMSDLISLNMNFYEIYSDMMIINLKSFSGQETNNLMILSNENNYVYSYNKFLNAIKQYNGIMKEPDGESTILFLVVAEKVIENYNEGIRRLQGLVTEIDESTIRRFELNIDALGEQSICLRQLTNLAEDFKEIVVSIKDSKFSFVNSGLIEYDFDVLTAKTQHLLDRCRSLRRYIADLKYDKDTSATTQLNLSMRKMTRIMALLAIIANVIAVPNTVATLYGVGKIAELNSSGFILILFAISTVIAAIISLYFWRIWGLDKDPDKVQNKS